MTYLSASKKNKGNSVLAIAVSLVVLVIGSYIVVPYMYDSLIPIYTWNGFDMFSSKELISLKDENASLHREVAELGAQLQVYSAASIPAPDVKNNKLIAKVLKRPPYTLFDTLLVDRGSIDGINKGMDVYAHNTLVGKVKDVFKNTASIELVTHPGNTLQAIFPGNISIDIRGVGNGAFEANIPRSVAVAKGDFVTGSDRDATLYGVVDYVESEEGDVYSKVYIDSPFNLYKESWVEIKTE